MGSSRHKRHLKNLRKMEKIGGWKIHVTSHVQSKYLPKSGLSSDRGYNRSCTDILPLDYRKCHDSSICFENEDGRLFFDSWKMVGLYVGGYRKAGHFAKHPLPVGWLDFKVFDGKDFYKDCGFAKEDGSFRMVGKVCGHEVVVESDGGFDTDDADTNVWMVAIDGKEIEHQVVGHVSLVDGNRFEASCKVFT